MLATERPAVVLSPTAPFPSGSRSCVALGFPAAVAWSVIGARPAGERVTLLAAALTLPARNQAKRRSRTSSAPLAHATPGCELLLLAKGVTSRSMSLFPGPETEYSIETLAPLSLSLSEWPRKYCT